MVVIMLAVQAWMSKHFQAMSAAAKPRQHCVQDVEAAQGHAAAPVQLVIRVSEPAAQPAPQPQPAAPPSISAAEQPFTLVLQVHDSTQVPEALPRAVQPETEQRTESAGASRETEGHRLQAQVQALQADLGAAAALAADLEAAGRESAARALQQEESRQQTLEQLAAVSAARAELQGQLAALESACQAQQSRLEALEAAHVADEQRFAEVEAASQEHEGQASALDARIEARTTAVTLLLQIGV